MLVCVYRDVVPNVMVMDGAKAQVEGEFRRKLCDAGFHIKKQIPTHNHPTWVMVEYAS
jgi:hypothetical protein